MRHLRFVAIAAVGLVTPAQASEATGPNAAVPICAFGRDAASYREEAYCTAQVALRSNIARSFALLAARMATRDHKLGAALRRLQDAEARADLLTRQERQARADGLPPAAVSSVRTRLEAAIGERIAARDGLETGYPQWIALTRPRPISEQDTGALLKRGEALVFWSVGSDATFAFAIDAKGATWERIPAGRAAIERAILDLRGALGVSGAVRGAVAVSALERDADLVRSRGSAVFRMLFPGSVGRTAARARTLLLVPSGPLVGLPFAALPTREGRDPRWLGLTKPIALLPSPADLRTLRAQAPIKAAPNAFVGFGAPDLRGGAPVGPQTRSGERIHAYVADLPRLPDAEGELRALATAMGAPADAVRTGPAATERAVKTADLGSARVIAFATHGLVAGEVDGLTEGALVLTPPTSPDAIDDGLLTASEAAELHLDADWVLLSACNTAAGDRAGGEALSGLAAAFGYAGARALLVSHWPVRDDAARRLTTLAIVDRAMGRGEALRRAMRSVAADRRHPEWHDPSIWAVMTLIGDPAR